MDSNLSSRRIEQLTSSGYVALALLLFVVVGVFIRAQFTPETQDPVTEWRPVRIEWEASPDAAYYEVEVLVNGKRRFHGRLTYPGVTFPLPAAMLVSDDIVAKVRSCSTEHSCSTWVEADTKRNGG